MTVSLSDSELKEALENCASEPVHIPGRVQPCGCVIAVDIRNDRITHASANADEFFGVDAFELLGRPLRDVLGRDISHALRNALAGADATKTAVPVGPFDIGGTSTCFSISLVAESYLIELEHEIDAGFVGADRFQTLRYLIQKISACDSQQHLFDAATDLLRALSSYDRVLVYKFDRDFNGLIVAENRSADLDALLGLRFPHWDIPPQARAMMKAAPLRFIEDSRQVPVPLLAQSADLPPLDISLAFSRGVSPVHMEYLRNANLAATMTLSIVVQDELWGMISFHHESPKVPSQALRAVLTEFADVFAVKLQTLMQQDRLRLIENNDVLNIEILDGIDENLTMQDTLPAIAPDILRIVDAQGLATLSDAQTTSFGQTPDAPILAKLFEIGQRKLKEVSAFENLSEAFPEFADGLNGCAGALVLSMGVNQSFCIFRQCSTMEIRWAGNPEKKIERVPGEVKLSPRRSFSSYLEMVEDRCMPWTEEDLYFAKRVRILISAAERRVLKNTIARQQTLMINELNHRVRNILALVQSVSEQSRRRNGALESYTASLQSRLKAMADAHEMTSGASQRTASVTHLINHEIEPYMGASKRVRVVGGDAFISAQNAPIFSLIIHELATNAAKYGSLSVDDGALDIGLTKSEAGLTITWSEHKGPVVREPTERGFGTALIEQAAPYEFGGSAILSFEETGVRAKIFLPSDAFGSAPEVISTSKPVSVSEVPSEDHPSAGLSSVALVLEDSFTLAKEMSDLLKECGIDRVEMVSNVKCAQELLTSLKPDIAILDVNLGPDTTGEPIALQLMEDGVPFIFLTGYGDQAELAEPLRHVPILTKPVSKRDLIEALHKLRSVPRTGADDLK